MVIVHAEHKKMAWCEPVETCNNLRKCTRVKKPGLSMLPWSCCVKSVKRKFFHLQTLAVPLVHTECQCETCCCCSHIQNGHCKLQHHISQVLRGNLQAHLAHLAALKAALKMSSLNKCLIDSLAHVSAIILDPGTLESLQQGEVPGRMALSDLFGQQFAKGLWK